MASTSVAYRGTGKRKMSVARVVLVPGSGQITVNGKPLAEYFPRPTLQSVALAPLARPAPKCPTRSGPPQPSPRPRRATRSSPAWQTWAVPQLSPRTRRAIRSSPAWQAYWGCASAVPRTRRATRSSPGWEAYWGCASLPHSFWGCGPLPQKEVRQRATAPAPTRVTGVRDSRPAGR